MGDLDLGYWGWSNVEDSFGDTATLDTPLEKKAIEPKPLLANSRPYSIIISDTPSFSFALFSFPFLLLLPHLLFLLLSLYPLSTKY